ncbi:hypothetical protein CYMTET_12364 [Cymbomonas tetramitiformis]|uniref:Uncharacterized protein n=1 Tax=Cymbomonas tetramitiformis TaxID=36881 RepID=A0AAE0GLU2_9CHLO|nr:hypothetical protein CYMTET_12364 [Cymbomonas tetramitiformis]
MQQVPEEVVLAALGSFPQTSCTFSASKVRMKMSDEEICDLLLSLMTVRFGGAGCAGGGSCPSDAPLDGVKQPAGPITGHAGSSQWALIQQQQEELQRKDAELRKKEGEIEILSSILDSLIPACPTRV